MSGWSDIGTMPYEGSKQGATGFFKGVGLGFAGVLAKPVSGFVDVVSKTSQGIENGVTGTTDCKENNHRQRKPRAFYFDLHIVKEYNALDATIY